MIDKPLVKIEYDEPAIPNAGVNTQDDVVNVLRSEGLLAATTYPGSVLVGGTPGTVFPFKWTVSKLASGHYRITHNLGHIKYVVVTTPTDVAAASDTVISNITVKTATYMDITWATTVGVPIDQYFDFILITYL